MCEDQPVAKRGSADPGAARAPPVNKEKLRTSAQACVSAVQQRLGPDLLAAELRALREQVAGPESTVVQLHKLGLHQTLTKNERLVLDQARTAELECGRLLVLALLRALQAEFLPEWRQICQAKGIGSADESAKLVQGIVLLHGLSAAVTDSASAVFHPALLTPEQAHKHLQRHASARGCYLVTAFAEDTVQLHVLGAKGDVSTYAVHAGTPWAVGTTPVPGADGLDALLELLHRRQPMLPELTCGVFGEPLPDHMSRFRWLCQLPDEPRQALCDILLELGFTGDAQLVQQVCGQAAAALTLPPGAPVRPALPGRAPTMNHFMVVHHAQDLPRPVGVSDSRVKRFAPDGWQRDLLNIVDAGESALVSAPTSSGKTFIAFYVIEKVLRERTDGRGLVVYVAPSKALVQQVEADIYSRFQKDYGKPSVHRCGIFTGEEP